MGYTLILEDRALREAQDAYNYYENKQVGLGNRFKKELEKSITYIETNPQLYQRIKHEIRQTLLYKFPYVVVYEIMSETIVIYSIFHTSRNPKGKFRK